jgi:hypothetical protein
MLSPPSISRSRVVARSRFQLLDFCLCDPYRLKQFDFCRRALYGTAKLQASFLLTLHAAGGNHSVARRFDLRGFRLGTKHQRTSHRHRSKCGHSRLLAVPPWVRALCSRTSWSQCRSMRNGRGHKQPLGELRDENRWLDALKSWTTPCASGLLALIFKEWFGTFERCVLESLSKIESLPQKQRIGETRAWVRTKKRLERESTLRSSLT